VAPRKDDRGWHSYAGWSIKVTPLTAEPCSKLSLTLMKRRSRLEAGVQSYQVVICFLEASKNGVLTESALLQAAEVLAELAPLLQTYGLELQAHLRLRPTITPSTQ